MWATGFLLVLLQEPRLLEAEAAHRAGDYGTAVAILAELTPSAESEYLWTQLYYDSGLPSQALVHAERGLAHAPEHLGLLHRSSSLWLWLGQPESALAAAEELGRAVGKAELSAEERPAWDAAANDFERRARQLLEARDERDGSLLKARAVSAGACLLFLGVLLVGRRS